MPVKRRAEKRRIDPERLYFVWSQVLDSGRDFFGELPTIDVPSDPYGIPDREAAQAAWRQFGPRLLLERNPREQRPTWAEREFGRPREASDAR